jgi:N-acetylated-alpha-linked acidic dipeptidase
MSGERTTMKTVPALCLCVLVSGVAPALRFTGYTSVSTARQEATERTLKSLPSPEKVRQFHRYLTAEPHPAGSARNHELALYIAEEWKRQGWQDVTVHRYDVYNSAPRQVTLAMVEPVRYTAELREAAYDVDPDTKNSRVSRGYLAMSASGEVTAPLVYARGGNPEDYELLEKNGIDVRGKVVIVRYSNPYSYRGFKALTAERRGAAALLIYSDPAEDGYKKGAVFPTAHGAPRLICSAVRSPTTSSCPAIRSHPDGRRSRAPAASSLRRRSRCRRSWQRSCRGTTRNRSSSRWTAPRPRRSGRAACRSPTAWAAVG